MCFVQRSGDLNTQFDNLRGLHRLARYLLIEGLAFNVLHRYEVMVFYLADFVDVCYVRAL
jgi:hypothetical protein